MVTVKETFADLITKWELRGTTTKTQCFKISRSVEYLIKVDRENLIVSFSSVYPATYGKNINL